MSELKDFIALVSPAGWLAIGGWLAYELRQWRLWYMRNHGGAPNTNQQGK